MSSKPTLLAFSGSARAGSYNKLLARVAAAAGRAAGADTTFIDLRDFGLPLYDGDLEERHGLPAGALELRRLFRSHQGLVIASPEYNHSFSPLLKNAIDWVSRRTDTEDHRRFFADKVVALLAASPGSSGGARGLPHLRQVLAHLGARVLDEAVTVPRHFEAFTAAGTLRDPALQRRVEALLAQAVAALAGSGAAAPA